MSVSHLGIEAPAILGYQREGPLAQEILCAPFHLRHADIGTDQTKTDP